MTTTFDRLVETYGYADARARVTQAARDLSWDEAMAAVKAGVYGDPQDVRRAAVDQIISRWDEDSGFGISSSDVNHTIYAMVTSGELTPDD